MNEMKRANVALVGVTRHGATLARAIEESPRLRLQGCFDVDAEAARNLAAHTGCTHYDSYSALLMDASLHGVVLATPNHFHHEQAIAALQAGKHLFVEKPLAVTSKQCLDIVALDTPHATRVIVGHNTRRLEVFRRVKTMLEENYIGTVVAAHAHMSFDFGLHNDVPEWKRNPRLCPLLPMTQLGIHFIDLLQHLVSPIHEVSAYATSRHMKSPNRTIDSTVAMLRFSSGALGSIHAHYITIPTYTVELYGTEGKIVCTETKIDATRSIGDACKAETIEIGGDGFRSFVEEMDEFAAMILDGARAETTAELGRRNVCVLEAMERSSATSTTVLVIP